MEHVINRLPVMGTAATRRVLFSAMMMVGLYFPSNAQQTQTPQTFQQLAQQTSVGLGLDSKQSGRFVQCFTEKLEQAKNALKKASPVQRRGQLQNMERQCLEDIDIAFRWGTASTENLRRYFLSQPQLSDFTENQRKQLVDCLIGQLHQLYPNGLNNLPAEVAQTIMAGCKKQIRPSGK